MSGRAVTAVPTKAKRVTRPRMSEDSLLRAILGLAHLRGFLVFHQRPLRRADGSWESAVQGDDGFPDLCMVRRGRVIFAELKARARRDGTVPGLTAGQERWRDALAPDHAHSVPCCVPEWYAWAPLHWHDGTIERVLR